MTERIIRSGALEVIAHFDGKLLRETTLSKDVPEEIEATDLAKVIEELRKHPFSVEDKPPFHQKVWEKMLEIPWGQALTYGEIAKALGNPKGSRAVGQACGKNPLPLLIPCHRVLGDSGIGGFSSGLPWKYKLLELEATE